MQGSASRLRPAVKENHAEILSVPSCLVHQVFLLSPSKLSKKYTGIIQGTASWILCYSAFFFQACCSVNTWLRHPEGCLWNSHLLSPHKSHRAVLYRTANFRHFWGLMQKGKGPGSIKWLHCFCSLKDCTRLCKSWIFMRSWSLLLCLNRKAAQVS